MAIITSTVKVGEKPPKEVIKAVKEIAKHPITYTEDCPESTPEALAEFAALRAGQKKQDFRPVLALRLMPETLRQYRSMGKDFAEIMGDVLNYAVNKPELLAQARQAHQSLDTPPPKKPRFFSKIVSLFSQ